MIKRPLVWILGGFLLGLYLAWQGQAVITVIILCFVYYFLSSLMMLFDKEKNILRRDKFLWLLPLFLMLGFFAMKDQLISPKLDRVFDQKLSCELNGKINMIVQKQWGRALYVKNDTIYLADGKEYTCENVIIFCYDNNKTKIQDASVSAEYLVGNQITVYGTLSKFSEPSNPGQFNEKLYYQIENIDYKMQADKILLKDARYSLFHALLDKIKNKLIKVFECILSEKEAGTIIAMLLGDKYLLDEEIKQLYQVNGISHVLAISGLHVSLIGMAVFSIFKKLKFSILISTILSIVFIFCYGVLTNFSVSTCRAVIMMSIMLFAAIFGKTYDMLSALALSAFLILLKNPLQIMSAGFLLSYGAVIGIAVIYPCLQKLFEGNNSLMKSLFLSISAQIATTPFILYFFYQFPVYSILTNLVILPFITVLTLTSILAGIAGAIYLPMGIFLAGGVNYILKFYEWICRIGTMLPKHLLTVGRPDKYKFFLFTILCILFVWSSQRYVKRKSILLLATALGILLLPRSIKGLEITVLDVGQGDAIYMKTENGTSYLIDGGSSDVKKVGSYRLKPFLLYQGMDCIDYAIVTHSDNDHISGLTELIEADSIKFKNLILPDINNKDEAYQKLEELAKRKKLPVQYISTGDYWKEREFQILCLHPSSKYTTTNANAYSTVLSVSYRDFDMLLTGDLDKEGETKVVELLKYKNSQNKSIYEPFDHLGRTIDYDVLKVAHHGSKNSTFENFLNIVKPEISMISCGKDNAYGHPNPELLERLQEVGSDVWITFECGAITIKTDGKRMDVNRYVKDYHK